MNGSECFGFGSEGLASLRSLQPTLGERRRPRTEIGARVIVGPHVEAPRAKGGKRAGLSDNVYTFETKM